MTEAEVRQLMRDFINDTLRDFEEGLSILPTSRGIEEKIKQAYEVMQEEDRISLVENDIAGVHGWLDELIEGKGLDVSKESVEYHRLGREMLKARQFIWGILAKRATGDYENEYDRFGMGMLQQSLTIGETGQSQQRGTIGKTLSQAFDSYIQQQTDKNQ